MALFLTQHYVYRNEDGDGGAGGSMGSDSQSSGEGGMSGGMGGAGSSGASGYGDYGGNDNSYGGGNDNGYGGGNDSSSQLVSQPIPVVTTPVVDPVAVQAEIDAQTLEANLLKQQLLDIQNADTQTRQTNAYEAERVLSARLKLTAAAAEAENQDSTIISSGSNLNGSSATNSRLTRRAGLINTYATGDSGLSVPTVLAGI